MARTDVVLVTDGDSHFEEQAVRAAALSDY